MTKMGQILEKRLKHTVGRIQEAESLYRKAISVGFYHEAAFSNLGIILKNSNRIEEAISIYKRAISSNPNFSDAYSNWAISTELGDLDQALMYTLKSIELNSNNPDANLNLGIIYQNLGKLDQALAYTIKSIVLKKLILLHMNLGITQGSCGAQQSTYIYTKVYRAEPKQR